MTIYNNIKPEDLIKLAVEHAWAKAVKPEDVIDLYEGHDGVLRSMKDSKGLDKALMFGKKYKRPLIGAGLIGAGLGLALYNQHKQNSLAKTAFIKYKREVSGIVDDLDYACYLAKTAAESDMTKEAVNIGAAFNALKGSVTAAGKNLSRSSIGKQVGNVANTMKNKAGELKTTLKGSFDAGVNSFKHTQAGGELVNKATDFAKNNPKFTNFAKNNVGKAGLVAGGLFAGSRMATPKTNSGVNAYDSTKTAAAIDYLARLEAIDELETFLR